MKVDMEVEEQQFTCLHLANPICCSFLKVSGMFDALRNDEKDAYEDFLFKIVPKISIL